MTNPNTLIHTPFAADGDKSIIQDDSGQSPNSATWEKGFPQITQEPISNGGIPPKRVDFNGVLNAISENIVHQTKGLGYEFDAAYAAKIGGYPLNARLALSNGDIVRNTVAGNTTNPNVDMTGWEKGTSASEVSDASGKTQQEVNNLLNYATYKTPRQFGGVPDDPSFDNKFALQAAFNSGERILLDGFYYTTISPYVATNAVVVGVGVDVSGIYKVGNALSGLSPIQFSETVTDIYDVDAVLIIRAPTSGNTKYAANLNLKNFSLRRSGSVFSTSLDIYGLYAPRFCKSVIEDLKIINRDASETAVTRSLGTAFFSKNAWMVLLNRVDATGRYNFKVNAGTSLIFNGCWAAGSVLRAYDFENLRYTTMNCCAADYVGSAENPAEYVYYFRNSAITMNGCSAEQTYCKLMRVGDSAHVTANNIEFVSGIYGDQTYDQLIDVTGNATLQLNGGRIRRDASCINSVYASRYSSILRVVDVIENFTFAVSRSSAPSDSNTAIVHYGTSTFVHIKGDVESKYSYITDDLAPSKTDNGLEIVYGNLYLTHPNSRFGTTSFTASLYSNPMRLGRLRIWHGNIDNERGIYYKVDNDPISATDGTLLNTLRAVSETPPVSRITGQYYLNTTVNENKPYWWNGATWRDALGNARGTKPSITGNTTPTTIAEQNAVINSLVSALVSIGLITDSRT